MEGFWQLQEAKARLSELVDRALQGEPQVVTRHGHKAVVVVDYETFAQISGQRRSVWAALGGRVGLSEEEADQLFGRQQAGYREVDF